MKKEKVKYMQVVGGCYFCGQQAVMELPESEWQTAIEVNQKSAEELADDYATEQCNCKEGMDWRAEREIMTKCAMDIDLMLGESYPEIAQIFQEAKGWIYQGKNKRIIVQTKDNGTASMYKTGANIEIKFVQKQEAKITVAG